VSSFSAFVESDAFLPILILLLVLLILVILWIFLSNNHVSKKKKKNVELDNTAVVKIVPDGDFVKKEEEKPEETEVVANTEEVKIVKDVITPMDVTQVIKSEPVVENTGIPKEELIVDIKVPSQDESSFEVPKPVDDGDPGEKVDIELTKPSNEENVVGQNIDIGLTSALDKNLDQGEEFEVPKPVDDGDQGTPAYKIDAFNFKPDDNKEINEDVKVEEPHEYTGEKTEIFNFDFDKDIDDKIIDAANIYIEKITGSVDEHEEKN